MNRLFTLLFFSIGVQLNAFDQPGIFNPVYIIINGPEVIKQGKMGKFLVQATCDINLYKDACKQKTPFQLEISTDSGLKVIKSKNKIKFEFDKSRKKFFEFILFSKNTNIHHFGVEIFQLLKNGKRKSINYKSITIYPHEGEMFPEPDKKD